MGGNQSPFYKRVSHHSVQTAPQEPAYDGMKNTGSSRDDTPVGGWEEEERITGRLPTPTPTPSFSFNLLEPDCYLSMNPPATTQQSSLFGSVSFCGIMCESCSTQPSHLLLHSGTSVAV